MKGYHIIFFEDLSFEVIEKPIKFDGFSNYKKMSKFDLVWIGEIDKNYDPVGVIDIDSKCPTLLRDGKHLNKVDKALFIKAVLSHRFDE